MAECVPSPAVVDDGGASRRGVASAFLSGVDLPRVDSVGPPEAAEGAGNFVAERRDLRVAGLLVLPGAGPAPLLEGRFSDWLILPVEETRHLLLKASAWFSVQSTPALPPLA